MVQTTAVLARVKPIWKDKGISLSVKMKPLNCICYLPLLHILDLDVDSRLAEKD